MAQIEFRLVPVTTFTTQNKKEIQISKHTQMDSRDCGDTIRRKRKCQGKREKGEGRTHE